MLTGCKIALNRNAVISSLLCFTTPPKKISDNMISVSEEKQIPYQIEVCSKSTGTNADVVSVSNYGIKTGLVSVPIRNMHTFSEVVSLEDIELSAKLIAEYILKKVKEHD